jgi:nucleoside-diphosphate-sugar epimerase
MAVVSILVIGAGGYVGGSVVRAAAAGEARVHALTRRPAPELEPFAKVHLGDARRVHLGLTPEDAGALAAGVTAIVVSTGSFDLSIAPAAAQQEHLAPLQGVLRFAAGCSGLRTVVLVSSLLAVGDTDRRLASDTCPEPVRHRNFYEWAKLRGERIARDSGVPVDIVRAGHVVGSTDGSRQPPQPAALFELVPALVAGWPLPVVGTGRYWCVPVDMAADVIVTKARHGTGGSSVWAVDPAAPRIGEILDAASARHGLHSKRIRSRRLGRAVAALLRPDWLDLPVARSVLDYCAADWRLDLGCLQRLIEKGAVRPPADRQYLLHTIDHEIARQRGLP